MDRNDFLGGLSALAKNGAMEIYFSQSAILEQRESGNTNMKKKYKNAGKDEILDKLIKLKNEQFPFSQPVLQRDTFWIYCNARRYWGTYINSLKEASIELEIEEIKSETGFKIDWWPFREGHNQREWLAIVLNYLFEQRADISAKGLKNSHYFDLYTDAVLLFGRYDVALEYSTVSKDMSQRISYPDSESIFRGIIEMYCCENQKQKCELLKKNNVGIEKNFEMHDQSIADCKAIVDGANVAYVRNVPSLKNVKLVDNYLQKKGFRKDNIIFIFDAAFKYSVNAKEFDELAIKDNRYAVAPAGEQADAHILTKALEEKKKNPGFPPFIISNDQYKDYFAEHPEFEELKSRKKGITWTFILKKPDPIISLLALDN